jgi:hypothetical protein
VKIFTHERRSARSSENYSNLRQQVRSLFPLDLTSQTQKYRSAIFSPYAEKCNSETKPLPAAAKCYWTFSVKLTLEVPPFGAVAVTTKG